MSVFLGDIPLKNPLIASSSPLTESMPRLRSCCAAGFAAAILKTAAPYKRSGAAGRRKVVHIGEGCPLSEGNPDPRGRPSAVSGGVRTERTDAHYSQRQRHLFGCRSMGGHMRRVFTAGRGDYPAGPVLSRCTCGSPRFPSKAAAAVQQSQGWMQ